jgi:mono/diheme cytochrome c family protein
MKTALKIAGVLLVLLVLIAAGGYAWASNTSSRILARTYDTHTVDFPVPYPLDAAEVAALGLTEEASAQLAMERAIERGRHLVEARYACGECHSPDFGGGVMIDAFPIGTLLGPNLTLGPGSRTLDYTPADWDRIVRHGILPNGRAAAMPSEDFRLMSDQELSDVIAYIRSMPPVDRTMAPPKLGPLGKFLLARGDLRLSANLIESHQSPHLALPPAEEPSVEFGRHLAATCTGCHGQDFSGGPIAGGDPSWAPARNLTPHETALASWSYDDFARALRENRRPDGTELRAPMSFMTPFAQKMKEVEIQAMWNYLRSIPEVPSRR